MYHATCILRFGNTYIPEYVPFQFFFAVSAVEFY